MKRWDVVAALRYTKRDGTEAKQYVRCGTAFDGEKGISLQLTSVPVRNWDGWLSLYEPREKDAAPQAPQASRRPSPNRNDPEDDIPF